MPSYPGTTGGPPHLSRGKQVNRATRIVAYTVWAITDGDIPRSSTSQRRAFESHESARILNSGARDAGVDITLYFSDRDPGGPYKVVVTACRTLHVRLNDLNDPAPTSRNRDCRSILRWDVPVVMQRMRLDSWKEALAPITTIVFAGRHILWEGCCASGSPE
ncbi:sensory rhodopsin transducer [Dankookia rubra]|uniref:sensory rhodopsin transducer n=1 Tax=Dankookia rubra TaxID=1442381 RepID=UPI0019D5CA7B|nr:sensory rhodopsin transducer [Dankookia rubra]